MVRLEALTIDATILSLIAEDAIVASLKFTEAKPNIDVGAKASIYGQTLEIRPDPPPMRRARIVSVRGRPDGP